MEIQDFLKIMVEKNASDLYLTVACPPMCRIDGNIEPIGEHSFSQLDLAELAKSILSEEQQKEFLEKLEMNLATSLPGISRFRVNLFRQRGSIGMVIRRVKVEISTVDELGLPSILKDIVMTKRGLVLVVGGTGSGKSTTLAGMIDHRNSNEAGHIISIEDPIEFTHGHKRSIITQREVGFDTQSFQDALKNAMRQAPDVILIGEIRDTETMDAAIAFADTGHLCLGTLHSTNANQAFERILNFFPQTRHAQILLQLSLNLRAIISQRLIASLNGGRVVAVEILLDTPRIKDLVKKGEIDTLKEAMEQGIHEGCQTFDQALLVLYKEGKVGLEEALANADSANNLRLKIKLQGLKGDDAIDKLMEKEAKEKSEKKPSAFQIKGMHPVGGPTRKI